MCDKLSNCEDPYLCPNCIITKQSDEITELKNLVKNLTSQLTMLKNSSSTNTKISSNSNMESNPPVLLLPHSSSEPNKSADHITSIVSSYLAEEKEKLKRQLNLVIHNLAESTSEESSARQRDDINQVTSVLQKYIEVTPTISKAIQLGKCKEKSRLLKITVNYSNF